VFAGIFLIACGGAILWAARDAGEVSADVARWQARQTRSARLRRLLEVQARFAPRAALWYGRAFALLAVGGGVVLLVRG
jgi:hypothetical protein